MTEPHQESPSLKTYLDLGPVLIFFVSYFVAGKIYPAAHGHASQPAIMWATGIFMAATLASLIASYIIEKKIHLVPLITATAVLVFGGLTIALHDDRFIRIKPTIIYTLFAATLLTGWALRKPFIKHVFQGQLHLSDQGWRVLTLRFGLFFVLAAIINEVIWRNFSFDFWITYKVWGMTALTFVFTAWQMMFVSRYHVAPPAPLNPAKPETEQPAQQTPQG
jgi:intracellular septation protein